MTALTGISQSLHSFGNAAHARTNGAQPTSAHRLGKPLHVTARPWLAALPTRLAGAPDLGLMASQPVAVPRGKDRGVAALPLVAKDGQMRPGHDHFIGQVFDSHQGLLFGRLADSLRTVPLARLIVAGQSAMTGGYAIRCTGRDMVQ